MKTENKPEEKAKYFAQYWGQECLFSGRSEQKEPYKANYSGFQMLDKYPEICYLQLKPLSSISDEDAIEVAMIESPDLKESHYKGFGQYLINNLSTSIVNNKIAIADFLRSRGYLLPYRDLSVEELINIGWAKERNG